MARFRCFRRPAFARGRRVEIEYWTPVSAIPDPGPPGAFLAALMAERAPEAKIDWMAR